MNSARPDPFATPSAAHRAAGPVVPVSGSSDPSSRSSLTPAFALGPARSVLTAADVARVTDRIAHQIIEHVAKTGFDAVLMGVPTRGVPLAQRLVQRIDTFCGVRLPSGALDITMYRDDLRLRGVRPLAETIEPEGGIDGRTVIVVDDVLFSGRSARAALDALTELGRPAAVRLAVLVDRGHRQLPIRADYVGKNLPTAPEHTVRVLVSEVDGTDGVLVDETAQRTPPDGAGHVDPAEGPVHGDGVR